LRLNAAQERGHRVLRQNNASFRGIQLNAVNSVKGRRKVPRGVTVPQQLTTTVAHAQCGFSIVIAGLDPAMTMLKRSAE
jgi:hypothetical protein